MSGEIARITAATSMQALAPPSEAGTLISILSRALHDVSIPMDRVERMAALYTDVKAQEAKRAFNEAMMQAQTEMRPVAADASNPQTKSKYASYAALDRAVRPIYTKYGFSLSFNTARQEADFVRVLCETSHAAGHSRQYEIDMPADGKGAKGGDVMTKTHATGSAVSYGQRYLLKMIFNIAVGDDDGNGAGGGTISDEQAEGLSKAIVDAKADLDKFLAMFKIESVADLPAKDYFRALGMVTAKKAKVNADR